MRKIVLLGPQRHRPTVAAALEEIGAEGTVAVVTAGWQEREAEVDELREHIRRPVVNLRLHERADTVFGESPEVFAIHRERQDRLKRLQRLYRLRLDHALEAARQMMRLDEEPEALEPEREAAIEAVRALDAHHRQRLGEVHRGFEAEYGERVAAAVAAHRRELEEVLAGATAVAVAGGHVAVLLNRLRLFGFAELVGELPVVAWSAGAMALGEQVVLFHDRPPQGAGNAEVLELGLGLYRGVLPLPHASRRLNLDDPVRVALLARRFAPLRAMAMDGGARLVSFDPDQGESWTAGEVTRRLTPAGEVVRA